MIEKERKSEFWSAFSKAQAEISNPTFDSVNPHFKNKYASLAAIRNAILPCMNKHGISVMQDIQRTEKGIQCTTSFIHMSGEKYISQPMEIPVVKYDAQALGSAMTYARRYQLQSLACVVGDADDDGEATVQPIKEQSTYKNKNQNNPPKSQIKNNLRNLTQIEKDGLDEKVSFHSDIMKEAKSLGELASFFKTAYNDISGIYLNTAELEGAISSLIKGKDDMKIKLNGDANGPNN